MTEHEPIFRTPNVDPEMDRARERARGTFKYFWRELSWEYRRIVPGLDLTAVKFPFVVPNPGPDEPSVEQMWASDIRFDGDVITGSLLNQPTWVPALEPGDQVSCPLAELEDWLYSIDDEAFGGYTVNVMRSRMDAVERQQHDSAWGLDFGHPGQEKVFPQQSRNTSSHRANVQNSDNTFASLAASEHPMSENMRGKIRDMLTEQPGLATQLDDRGWSMLHSEALAGNATPCELLVRFGADVSATTPSGYTALDLARKLNWENVIRTLQKSPSSDS